MKPKNILITGPPGCGKSTLIEKVAGELCIQPIGFITREVREGGNRVGFSIDTFDGRSDVLAHIGIKGPYRVGKYGVRIETINKVAVPSLKAASADVLIVIDEIGKMECLSRSFRDAVVEALDSRNPVLATIAMKGDPFIEGLKAREDVVTLAVNRSNRDTVLDSLLNSLREIVAVRQPHV